MTAKRWVWLALLIGGMVVSAHAQHFNPVEPTGLPWAVVIDSAHVGDDLLSTGDEVAAFDGTLCVGMATVDGEWPLALTCWEGDPGFGLEGFTAGHPIEFRYYVALEAVEVLDVEASFVSGDGTFGTGTFSRVSLSAAAVGIPETLPTPTSITLSAYPNPFNAFTTISFETPVQGTIRLRLYDVRGRLVATLYDGSIQPGNHLLNWDASGQPSGTYFLQSTTESGSIRVHKLVLIN